MARHLILCLAASALGLNGLTGCRQYDAARFSGDASILDKGAWSSPPRWTIAFPEVPLDTLATHRYTITGLPQHPLMFVLVPSSESSRTAIPTIHSAVKVSMMDDLGNVLFDGGGPLNPFGAGWKHSEPQFEYYLSDVPSNVIYSTDRRYTLIMAVSPSGHVAADVSVRPVIRGGGNELSSK